MRLTTEHIFDRLIWLSGKHVLLAVMTALVVALSIDGADNYLLQWMRQHWIGGFVNALPTIFLLCVSVLIGAQVKTSSAWFLALCLPYMVLMLGLLNYTLVGSAVTIVEGEVHRAISAVDVTVALFMFAVPLFSWFMARISETHLEKTSQLKLERDAALQAISNLEAASKAKVDAGPSD